MRFSALYSLVRRLAPLAGLLLAVTVAAADEMKPPRLVTARIDWTAALAAMADVADLRTAALNAKPAPAWMGGSHFIPRVLTRLNAITARRFPGIAASPVPVLLPFDVGAWLSDPLATAPAGDGARALSGFRTGFFFPGPAGYDAAFTIRLGDIPEFVDTRYSDPIEIQISGSTLLYQLDEPSPVVGAPASALEAEFPGIRRLIHEHHLRYSFTRFGVPYVVSLACFDAGVPRYKMPTCRAAEAVAAIFLRALRVAGGTMRAIHPVQPLPLERPARVSPVFTFQGPGQLLPGTGFHGNGGSRDYTVYSQMRFPLADAPAYANSQTFQGRNPTPNAGYPWRDNFCERRGFPVGQCPAGLGHQGQDIRPAPCRTEPGTERCERRADIVAVRDGVILRSPGQEAVYLVVNTATEHLRFRYLHMRPRKLDEDNVFSGRRVREGEVIGQVGNFSNREGGTSYHLHFDIQVPTRNGWVFVNPYMTLAASYERLTGGRGEELGEPPPPPPAAIAEPPAPTLAAAAEPALVPPPPAAEPPRVVPREVYRVRHHTRSRHHRHRIRRR